MSDDPRAEPPAAKPTVSLPAVTDRALLEDVARTVRNMSDVVVRLDNTVSRQDVDLRDFGRRFSDLEGRVARVENPSRPPPRPLTSDRVREVIEGHPSQLDLETAQKQAEEFIRGQQRDQRIAETHDLAMKAATKDDLKKLADSTATKAEVEALLVDAAKAQTTDIVTSVSTVASDLVAGVSKVAEKSATVRLLLLALAGLAIVMLNAATNYFTIKAAGTPPQQQPSLSVPK